MIKVIDNFLPQSEFEFLQTEMLSDRIPWYYNDFEIVDTDTRHYQYTHTLYNQGYESGAFMLMDPLIKKLKLSKLLRSPKIPRSQQPSCVRNLGKRAQFRQFLKKLARMLVDLKAYHLNMV